MNSLLLWTLPPNLPLRPPWTPTVTVFQTFPSLSPFKNVLLVGSISSRCKWWQLAKQSLERLWVIRRDVGPEAQREKQKGCSPFRLFPVQPYDPGPVTRPPRPASSQAMRGQRADQADQGRHLQAFFVTGQKVNILGFGG